MPDYRSLPIGQTPGAQGANIIPPRPQGNPRVGALSEILAQQLSQAGNPLARFVAGARGQDPYAGATQTAGALRQEDALGLQERGINLQEQQATEQTTQFLVNKQMAVGRMAVEFFEKVAASPPETRAAITEVGSQFLMPLLKELGLEVPASALQAFTSIPNTAGTYAALVTPYFGTEPEKIGSINQLIGRAKPEQVPGMLKTLFEQDRQTALPAVQRVLEQYTRTIRSDRGLMSRLGAMSPEGKTQPLPGSLLINQFAGAFKAITGRDPTPAEHAAGAQVLSDPSHAGFLASIGVAPGQIENERLKVLAQKGAELETPQGQAALEATRTQTAVGQRDLALGKVVPFQEGGGIATVKPGGVEVLQPASPKIAQADTMRKEFLGKSKRFETIRDFYQRAQASAKTENPISDISLLYSYIKVIDPDSVVREGERATVENAPAVPDKIRSLYNTIIGGRVMAKGQRQQVLQEIKSAYQTHATSQRGLEKEYRRLAKERGLPESQVTVDLIGEGEKSAKDMSDEEVLAALRRFLSGQ